ncbi:MAG: hypothetical protein ACU0CI_08105 [Shimia sp.]
MRTLLNIADDIPGLLKAALLFNGETISKGKISVAWLRDGENEAMVDLSGGIEDVEQPGLTKPMKSYLSGMVQVGEFLKVRKTVDEDGVEADDIERAALLLAFPKVAKDDGAMKMLKAHLDALQNFGVVEKIGAAASGGGSDKAAAPAEAEVKPVAEASDAKKDDALKADGAELPKADASAETSKGDAKATPTTDDDALSPSERRERRRERRRLEAEKAAQTGASSDAAGKLIDEVKSSAQGAADDAQAAFGEATESAKDAVADASKDAKAAVAEAVSDAKGALKLDPAVNDAITGGDAAKGTIATQQAKTERRGFFSRT